MISNLVAAVAIPAVFPLVEMQSAGTFAHQFLLILRRVFPLLITPRSCGCVGASLSTCGAFRW